MAHLKKGASGHLLKNASGHLVNACVPCSCSCDQTEWQALIDSGTPCGGLVQCYRLVNYIDGDIPASTCGDCIDWAYPIWDGTFPRPENWPQCSSWDLGQSGDPSSWWQMDGKALAFAESHLWLFQTPVCYWEIILRCGIAGGYADVWQGRKSFGITPKGIYTRIDGCAGTPSALEIEECP